MQRFDVSDKYTVNDTNGKPKNGCYLSTGVGFLLVLLAIAIAVGVGLIVHFAGNNSRELICNCPAVNGGTNPPSIMYLRTECKKIASAGDTEICNSCRMSTVAPSTQPNITGAALTTSISPPPPTTTTPAPKVTDVRIPMALYPLHFDVELRPNIYDGPPEDFTFDGYVRIQLRCDTPANNVTLHMNRLIINNSTLEFGAEPGTASAPSIVRWVWDKDRQFMVIHLNGMLVKDGLYYVKMNYTSPLKDDLAGLYLSSYKRDNKTVYLATTQFQPTDARKAFPCFGEPAVKSYFNITLIRKNHMKSLSNMPVARMENRGDNWVADIFQTTPKMPVYLLAFVVCDFSYTSDTTVNNVLYRIWSRPAWVSQTTFALEAGVKMLTYYEADFDIPYPLPKQDMIAIPDFNGGAMENWGLIVYREDTVLYKPGVSTEHNKQYIARVIAHELAHQWFGNLVSPSWWDDLWLNEGFATFEEFVGTDFVYPDWKMWDQFALATQRVFNFDGLISSHPVYVPVGHPDEVYEIFDDISYLKGAAIIRMMKFFLGEQTFKTGLSNYLKKLSYGAAFHDDLWQSMTDQSVVDGKNMNVKEIMDTWTLQMNYPVVMVTRVGNNRIRVSQQRYVSDPSAVDPGKYTSDFGYMWEIPFTFTSSKEKNFNKTNNDVSWIRKTATHLEIDSPSVVPDQSDSNSWIVGNPMQYGYYRVNYDTQNWQALINQLKTDHTAIHPVNRAQIINDAWNLAKSGMLSLDIALQTVEYLDKEMDYVPWVAAARELTDMKIMLAKTELYGRFEAFIRSKGEGTFKKLGMDNAGATHLESFVRTEIAELACTYGVKACIDESLRLYREWMKTPDNNPIDPDLKTVVYCAAIEHGGEEEWDFAYRQYKTATVAAESSLLLKTMGCARKPWIISRYLERALSGEVRKQDALDVFIFVSKNPIGHSIAWDYFRNKWDLIIKEFAASFFSFVQLIGDISKPFNTQFDLDQLQNFMDTHPNQGVGSRAFQQALEKTRANVRWMDNNLETVKTWLEKQAVPPPPTPKPKVTDVRIPAALYPLHFDVELRPNIYDGPPEDFTFDGYVRIQLRCDTPANNVTLHMNKLIINNSTLEFGAEPGTASAPSITRWDWDKDRQFMVIHLNGMLVKDGIYYFKMNYTSPLKDDLAGLYLSSYKRNNRTVYLATTQFQPTDARKAFPCYDEPSFKSYFNITLVRKNHMKSLSNMPIAQMIDRGDNWVADVYETSPKMPVYLLAFIICDYVYENVTTQNDVLFRTWSRPSSISQTSYALDIGGRILTYYEAYFDIAFPLPKQDMVAVPDFVARAMENWGLIIYRESAMLYQPGVSTERNKGTVAYVVAHELAHQWFGNLVSPSWWDDLWLNEGFATFEGYMGVDFVHPNWKIWEQFALVMQNAFNFDGLISSHPVYVPVGHPDEIYEIFDSISYEKGAAIIRMMRFFLGEQTFQTGLSKYLKKLAYGAAFHDDLWQSMTEQAALEGKNMNVKEIMDTWTLQMNYPVVMVTRMGSSSIRVTQQRYLRDPNAADPGKYTSPFGYKWNIPFTFTSSKEKKFNKTDADVTWIMKNASQMEIYSPPIVPSPSDSNSWILGNPKMIGYYRVNYETQNWQALINQLKTDPRTIDPMNRAQIINDAWNLAKAGMLSQNIAFQTVEYLDKEMDYVPWRAASRELAYVKSMLSRTGVFGSYEGFMMSKVEGIFQKLGMDNSGSSHLETYLRSQIAMAACDLGVKSCIDESLRLYRQWMNNEAVNPIDPDLKSTVYCSAIRYGGVEEWDFAYKQYETATVAAESDLLLTAMGCSRKPWILSRYLERALDLSQIRKQDALDVFVYVSSNPVGQGIAWDFFVAKWDLILSDYSGSFFAFRRLIEGTTSSFNTQTELDQLQSFMDTHPNLGTGTRAFQQAVEKTKANIKWMDDNLEIVKTWLNSQVIPPTIPKPKVTDVRIPAALYPLHFDVELRPNIYDGPPEDFTFDGYVRIQLRCDTPTNNVTLHMNKLVINNSTLEFGAEPGTAAAPSITRWDWDKDRQFMVIHLNGMLVKDGLYYVKMNYTSPLKDDLAGLYLSSYKRDNRTVYLATTQFQPTDARKAFPCYDEPSFKSYFNITLVRKNHMKSLSNMPIAQMVDRGDNWVADVYETSPKMPVYLLAFIICDYVYENVTTQNDVLFRTWSRPSSISQTSYALDIGGRILTYYEAYFDIAFPLPKQDMVAVPDFVARAMENWGLIIYRESAMLYQPGVSTERNKGTVAYVVAHELAHQWFGNLVSPSWWDDLWLNEGFATFEGYMGVDFVHPDWKIWEQFALVMQNAFNFDGLISSHPVYVPVGHPDEIYEIFDSISYEKGAAIIRMMRFFLGEQTFQIGLSNYLKKLAYGAAFHDDLWQSMTEQAALEGKNMNVKEIMDTWTLQMNYPVVMVTRAGSSSIRVTQQRYLRDPNAADPGKYTSPFGYRWNIPFTFTSSKEMNFNKTYADVSWIMRNVSQMEINSPSVVPSPSDSNSWILGNPMMTGYYRVNYDTQNWQALINQLKTDPHTIDPMNRAQIINDAWNLAKAGMLSQNIAFQTVEYLDKEMDYVPWRAASRELAYVKSMLSRTGVFGSYEAFMRSKVQGIFQKLGMDNTGSTHLETYLRSQMAMAACDLGVKSCIDESLRLYRQWMNNEAVNPIDPDLKSTVYCAAIRYGGVEEWDFAYEQYETATVAAESDLLLTAMGCSRKPWILSRYLERALDLSQIRKQDALDVFVYVSSNPVGQGIAWDYFVTKWDLILSDYSGSFFAFRRLIEGTTSSFNTQIELDQLQSFMDSHPNLGTGTRAFQQAVEKTKANIKWMDDNLEIVKTWLNSQDVPPTTPRAKVTDVRIPMALYPVYYDVDIRPNIYTGPPANFTFDGYVRIQLRCDTPTNNVTLHMNRLIINNSTLEFGAEPGTATAPSIVRWDWDKDRQFMVIHLNGMLQQGSYYYIKMNYTSPLKDDLFGLYLSSYQRGNTTVYLATTQFQPIDARKVFPCFDEPAIKSFFNITLVRKNNMVSLSNMPIARMDDRGDNWVADVYETSAKMPVYLIALVVCDYVYANTTTQNNVLFRTWSRPASISQTSYALDIGGRILTYFEGYFDIAYPLPKQDMIAVPDHLATAMENWGLIIYRENTMLYQSGVSTQRNKEIISYWIAHELAHQWFGNLVSPSWWDDIWLNEGFATFVGYMGVDFVQPSWKMWELFSLVLHNAFAFDGLISSHPVYVPIGHPDEIYEIFDSISYEKGAAVIRMMRFFLGENTFRTGLSNYLKRLAYGAAFHDDLWQSMTDQAALDGKNINVKGIMDTWTLQMNYPVVMVTREGNTGIKVTQQRYLTDPTASDPGKYISTFHYKWDIPFTFTSSKDNNFNKTDADVVWIMKNMTELTIESPSVVPDLSDSNSWIVGNPMQYGYYRVNYDPQNWQALINQLKTDAAAINLINRGQIINDAWNLAKAGMLSLNIALQTVEYLDQEMDYVPWRAANRELGYVKTMLSKTGVFGGFQAFMRSKAEGIFNTLGMNNTGATHLESYMRSEIATTACDYGVQSCIDQSLSLYRQWMSNEAINPINPDLRSTVYCSAIRYGGVAEWDFAYKNYKAATVAAESVLLLTAMGCSRQPWILSRYLERALTPSQIRKQDALDVFVYVSNNPVGQGLAWDYFVTKWDLILSEYAGSFLAFGRMIEGTTASFNRQFELDQLQSFIDSHSNLGSGTRAFQQAVEKTRANIKWMNNNLEIVKTWLTNQGHYSE